MVGCVLSQLKLSELYTLNSGKGRVREAGGIISWRMHGTFTKMVHYIINRMNYVTTGIYMSTRKGLLHPVVGRGMYVYMQSI